MKKKQLKDSPEEILKYVVSAMQEKKAHKIVSLDLTYLPNAVANYFVICDAHSKTQAGAIYDFVLELVKKNCGIDPFNREGFQNAEWILIDYVNVVVHIFLEEIRDFYLLENLWGDAEFTTYKSTD